MKKAIGIGAGILAAGIAGVSVYQYGSFSLRKRGKHENPLLPKGIPSSKTDRDKMLEGLVSKNPEKITVTSEDGLKLTGYLFRTKPQNDLVIISFHGYHSSGLAGMGWFAPVYGECGADYLIVNERAHEDSKGNLITFGVKEKNDGIRWVREIILRYGTGVKIFLHGVSMGAATIMMMAPDRRLPMNVIGFAEDCGYDDMGDEYRYLMRKYPKILREFGFVMMNLSGLIFTGCSLYDASPVKTITKSVIPGLFIHGTEDKMVPYEMGQNLYQAYNGPKEFFTVKGAGHARCRNEDPEGYRTVFTCFVKKCLETAGKNDPDKTRSAIIPGE